MNSQELRVIDSIFQMRGDVDLPPFVYLTSARHQLVVIFCHFAFGHTLVEASEVLESALEVRAFGLLRKDKTVESGRHGPEMLPGNGSQRIVNRQSKITQLLAQLIHSFRTFGLALPTLGASATMFLAHFLPLLLLFGREDFGNSIVRVSANHSDPSVRLTLGQAGVASHFSDSFEFVFQQETDFLFFLVGQVELLVQSVHAGFDHGAWLGLAIGSASLSGRIGGGGGLPRRQNTRECERRHAR